MTLSGKDGEIRLGDLKVASKSEWSMDIDPDFNVADARAFGATSKTWLFPQAEVSGTFSTQGEELIIGGVTAPGPVRMNLYQTAVPAWWGRLKHRLLKTEWPTYVSAEFDADYDYSVREGPGEESIIEGSFNAVGPVRAYTQPMSWLERLWDRICSTIKGSN